MSKQLTIQQKAQRAALVTKVAVVGIGGVIIAPFVGTAIVGITGFIAAFAIVGISLAVAPILSQKVANWKLQAMKAEAAKNPVETLQLDLLAREETLAEHVGSIEKLNVASMTFADQVKEFNRDYPDDTSFDEQLDNMRALLEGHKEAYKEAKLEVDKFRKVVRYAASKWKTGQAAAEAKQALGGAGAVEDFHARLKTETSFEAIQDSMNRAFAQLDTLRLQSRETRKQLPATLIHQ